MTTNAVNFTPDSFAIRRCRIKVELASYRLDGMQKKLDRRLASGDAVAQEDIEFYQDLVKSSKADLALAQLDLEEAISKGL